MKLRTALGIAALLLVVPVARAGTLKGSVKLPEGSRSTRLFQGYWRLENGNVPVQNSGGAKAETVVVLDNLKGKAPSARTVTIGDRWPRRPASPGGRRAGVGPRDQEHREGPARAVDPGHPAAHAARIAPAGSDPPPEVRRRRGVRHPRQRVSPHHGVGARRRLPLLRRPGRKGELFDRLGCRRARPSSRCGPAEGGRRNRRSTRPPRRR